MPGATTTTAAQALNPLVDATVEEVVFRNVDSLLRHFEKKTISGNPAWQWPINTAGNASAEVYVENQAAPAAGNQTYVRASQSIVDFRIAMQFSGQMQRAFANDRDRYFDVIADEIKKAEEDLRDLITATFLGTGSNGLDLAVDSAGTYAGINRSGNTWWQSQETALGGALTVAALEDLEEVARDNERAAHPTLILSRQNQITNYHRLVGPGASTSLYRINQPEGGGPAPINAGSVKTQAKFGVMDWFPVPDMTTTLIYMLQSDCFFVREQEKIHVEDKPFDADGKVQHIMAHMSFICRNPFRCSKLTGVTA